MTQKNSWLGLFLVLLLLILVRPSSATVPSCRDILDCAQCIENPICAWCPTRFTTSTTGTIRTPRCVENTKRYSDRKWRHGWGNITEQLWVDFAGPYYRDFPTPKQTEFTAKNYAIVSLEKCFATGVNPFNEVSSPLYTSQLKAFNPAVLVLWYYNVKHQYVNCYRQGHTLLEHPDWWVYNDAGVVYGSPALDLENNFTLPIVQDYVVDAALNMSLQAASQYDGVFMDGTAEQKPRDMSQARYDPVYQGKKSVVIRIRERMNQIFSQALGGGNGGSAGPKLLGNSLFLYGITKDYGMNTLDYMDGSCFEHFLCFEMVDRNSGYPRLDKIQIAFDNIQTGSSYGAPGGKIILVRAFPGPVSQPIIYEGPSYKAATGLGNPGANQTQRQLDAQKWVTPMLAAYLIIANENTFYSYNWWYSSDTGVYPCPKGQCGAPEEWYPELWKKIGEPLGNYTKTVEGGHTLYRRSFKNCNVSYDASSMLASTIQWLEESEDVDYCPASASNNSGSSVEDQTEFYPLHFKCPTQTVTAASSSASASTTSTATATPSPKIGTQTPSPSLASSASLSDTESTPVSPATLSLSNTLSVMGSKSASVTLTVTPPPTVARSATPIDTATVSPTQGKTASLPVPGLASTTPALTTPAPTTTAATTTAPTPAPTPVPTPLPVSYPSETTGSTTRSQSDTGRTSVSSLSQGEESFINPASTTASPLASRSRLSAASVVSSASSHSAARSESSSESTRSSRGGESGSAKNEISGGASSRGEENGEASKLSEVTGTSVGSEPSGGGSSSTLTSDTPAPTDSPAPRSTSLVSITEGSERSNLNTGGAAGRERGAPADSDPKTVPIVVTAVFIAVLAIVATVVFVLSRSRRSRGGRVRADLGLDVDETSMGLVVNAGGEGDMSVPLFQHDDGDATQVATNPAAVVGQENERKKSPPTDGEVSSAAKELNLTPSRPQEGRGDSDVGEEIHLEDSDASSDSDAPPPLGDEDELILDLEI